MSIDLPTGIEDQLRTLAATQGRDICALVEDAIRQYLEASAITDVDGDEVAKTQITLAAELPDVADWKAGNE